MGTFGLAKAAALLSILCVFEGEVGSSRAATQTVKVSLGSGMALFSKKRKGWKTTTVCGPLLPLLLCWVLSPPLAFPYLQQHRLANLAWQEELCQWVDVDVAAPSAVLRTAGW